MNNYEEVNRVISGRPSKLSKRAYLLSVLKTEWGIIFGNQNVFFQITKETFWYSSRYRGKRDNSSKTTVKIKHRQKMPESSKLIEQFRNNIYKTYPYLVFKY